MIITKHFLLYFVWLREWIWESGKEWIWGESVWKVCVFGFGKDDKKWKESLWKFVSDAINIIDNIIFLIDEIKLGIIHKIKLNLKINYYYYFIILLLFYDFIFFNYYLWFYYYFYFLTWVLLVFYFYIYLILLLMFFNF